MASALVLYRVLESVVLGAPAVAVKWSGVVAVLSVLSMIVGNLLALVQRDIKRMLAYSGIAHMGYLLLAFVTLDRASLAPVIVYLLAYVLMNAGAFTVVTLLYNRPGEHHLISDLSGWGYRYPLLGACLAILYLGSPPARLAGAALLFIGLLLDTVDGVVARARSETSLMGSVLDIAADRTYELSLWVSFAYLGLVPAVIP